MKQTTLLLTHFYTYLWLKSYSLKNEITFSCYLINKSFAYTLLFLCVCVCDISLIFLLMDYVLYTD